MAYDQEIHQFLLDHLNAIANNDLEAYHASTSEDLTLYEWFVTPHRLEGLPFHDFMMSENARLKTVFGAEVEAGSEVETHTRMDLANLHIQRYGDTAIASYTLLVSSGTAQGVKVVAHNESRVIVKLDGKWKVVHVHKSPAYQSPHVPPLD
jgi:ketosteroid isomerase-like protein